MSFKWEAKVFEWESEPYWLYAATLPELIQNLPDSDVISHFEVYQIGNPVALEIEARFDLSKYED